MPRHMTDGKADTPVSMLFPTEKESRLLSLPRTGGMGPVKHEITGSGGTGGTNSF